MRADVPRSKVRLFLGGDPRREPGGELLADTKRGGVDEVPLPEDQVADGRVRELGEVVQVLLHAFPLQESLGAFRAALPE